MGFFEGKHILLGITGSIASFKAVDLASRLTKAGAAVDVIMTEAAQRFVMPLSFRSVTGRKVYLDMWEADEDIQHIALAEWADVFVIAPITANTLAKIAHGLADNLLSLTALASRCPLIAAPAMDVGMYSHPSTQANVRTMIERGVTIVGPVEGRMASGQSGIGRMVEPAYLESAIRYRLGRGGPLEGVQVLVTAGPTRESIDPVRYLSNRSSGKQGYALAQAALDLGAEVTLVSGPVHLDNPVGANVIPVNSAIDMQAAVDENIDSTDILLMSAAVADFRPAEALTSKLKKDELEDQALSLSLVGNPDILKEIGKRRAGGGRPNIVLGFAAETDNLIQNAEHKLRGKNLDFIAVNDVSRADRGFSVDDNRVTLISADGSLSELPLSSKEGIARKVLEVAAEEFLRRRRDENNG
ncbi:MAG: bifunctional phosphopantothenoylcysteine decarboxylase/phosphopantothenate--cysteine ligase CoaBC [Candidatus Promineifilaceae bacterium]|jgi:phosphopantothenoylcysteine decarboxylase/phosphopantothenate--cysteine ligase